MSETTTEYLQSQGIDKRKQNLRDETNGHLSDLFDCIDLMDKEQHKQFFEMCLDFIIENDLDKTFRKRA